MDSPRLFPCHELMILAQFTFRRRGKEDRNGEMGPVELRIWKILNKKILHPHFNERKKKLTL